MNSDHEKAFTIFYPDYFEKIKSAKDENVKFVQYTSAEAAMSIITKEEVWLRNARCMNDFREIEHGLDCLVKAFRNEHYGKLFKETLDSLFPNIIGDVTSLFDRSLPAFKDDTYILCVSEHLEKENSYGRLSMWRAYGGKRSVALVMNPAPFASETDIFHAYTYPVSYQDNDNFNLKFSQLTKRIIKEQAFIKSLGKEAITGFLFETFKSMTICTKHPGFEEEKEWRVVYNPKIKKSEHVSSSIQCIDGIPQEIHKIPLRDFPELNFFGATVPELIERIIIGPNDQQLVLRDTFANLLRDAGVTDPYSRIHCSGIPLR